ncbi:MAG: hypothetical protein LW701_00830 [Fluviicola sp.]|nr:hypothetical protein [Fluviicola sp.]
MKINIIFISILTLLFSCNKVKRASKLLMKGEKWEVTSVKVDNNSITEIDNSKTTWEIEQGVDIYKAVPQLIWKKDSSNSAILEWQYQEKAKKFILNYIQQCEECDGSQIDELDSLSNLLSGTYDLEKRKRKNIIFKSSNIVGYPNQEVTIEIKKK